MKKNLFNTSITSFHLQVYLLTSLLITSLMLPVDSLAFAPMTENSCRAKAKEVAAESYKGCMTEIKSAQIEKLKNDYQKDLKALKNKYENEIKKMGATSQNKTEYKTDPKLEANKADSRVENRQEPKSEKEVSIKSSKEGSAVEIPGDSGNAVDIPEPIPVETY